jgi:4-hydroxybenzoate polyprenyltransferase
MNKNPNNIAAGAMIRLARPRHWIKNVVVFIPVVFGMRLGDSPALARAVIAAIAFCLASSFSYIINDLKDRRQDLAHPLKKDRPLACGQVSVTTASVMAAVLGVVALTIAGSLSILVFLIVAAFMILQMLYTLVFKEKALIDVICIALGFVLRGFCGVVAIRGEISPWLFICMFTLCLFMGFCKRYNEMVTISDRTDAGTHRRTLIAYTPELLTHLVTLSAGIAVVGFLLYSLSESTIKRFGTIYFVYTLPVVIYGIFRFAMLSMRGVYSDPTDIILRDRPFQLNMIVWIGAAVCIISYGQELGNWLGSLY